MSDTAAIIETTPQTEPAKVEQVPNSGGGYSFATGAWKQLLRFLILGAEGGTYYVSSSALTANNIACLDTCMVEDPRRTVDMIVDVSKTGRAPKNDAAIRALAYVAKRSKVDTTRALAYQALPDVCRIGTHLFQFADAVAAFGGWGAGTRRAIARWYKTKSPKTLAKQVTKYQSRTVNGNTWSHRDLLRLSHIRPSKKDDVAHLAHNDILAYIVDPTKVAAAGKITEQLGMIHVFEQLKAAPDFASVLKLVQEHNPPWELVPTQYLNQPTLWEALLGHGMPLTALTRSLARMTSIGLLTPFSEATKLVIKQLGNQADLLEAKLHPIKILAALMTYRAGHGVRGKLTWSPIPKIVDALDDAFYAAFGMIEPTGKRFLIALDVSYSMSGGDLAGVPGLSPCVAGAALAMQMARTEPEYHILGFAGSLRELGITAKDTIDSAMKKAQDRNFGSTDCSLPFTTARALNWDVDCFVTITDNDTNSGSAHPFEALRAYRRDRVADARSVVMAMTSTGFTIADPSDELSLDVVGFDTATPTIVADFAAGRI